MNNPLRLLIIEDNPIIAADIHRIVEAAYPTSATFARSFEDASPIIERSEKFDLAAVNPPTRLKATSAAMQRLARSSDAIVVCSAAPVSLAGTPLEGAEFLLKPYSDDEFLAACRRAMSRAER